MGKLIAVLLLAGAGFGIYWTQFHQSPAYKAYLRWAEAVSNGDCNTLAEMGEGKAKEWADGFCTPAGGMTVFGQTISGRSAAQMVQELRSTPSGAMLVLKREKQSETEEGGLVRLVVVESVGGRPSNFSKPAPPRRHEVAVREQAGQWKVAEFKDTDL